ASTSSRFPSTTLFRSRSTHNDYDADNNLIRVIDTVGTITEMDYDQLNRKVRLVEAVGLKGLQRSTTYTYDADNNLSSQTNPIGRSDEHTSELQSPDHL